MRKKRKKEKDLQLIFSVRLRVTVVCSLTYFAFVQSLKNIVIYVCINIWRVFSSGVYFCMLRDKDYRSHISDMLLALS